jgi:hypothetical protein
MTTTVIALTALAAVALGAAGGAKVAAVPDMRRRADHLGFSVTAYRLIGSLELAGVAGLIVGLAIPALAMAAAVGLLLMMVGAVISHLRAGDRVKGALPAIVVGFIVAAQLVSTVVSL